MSPFPGASKMKGPSVNEPKTGLLARIMICPLILAILVPVISRAQNPETEKSAIERAIHASIAWAKEKDFRLLYRAFDWSSYNVDLLFMEHFDRSSPTQDIIRDIIKPKFVVLMPISRQVKRGM